MVSRASQFQQNLRLLIMSFIIASDIQTQQTIWVSYKGGEMALYNNEPIIAISAQLSNHYATVYSGEK